MLDEVPQAGSEEFRLETLDQYRLAATPPEAEFDRLARLAARLFQVPIALVSLVDRDHQFFKAVVGLDVCETSREVSFCAHAILSDDILFVPDATKDPRFCGNPLVLGPPFIRFYAGKPLVAPNGARLGTLCLIDNKPRPVFPEQDRKHLSDLAALVMERMELRRLDHARTVSEARFQGLAAASPDAIVFADEAGSVSYWSPSAATLFGYSAAEMIGQPARTLIVASSRAAYDAELSSFTEGPPSCTVGSDLDLQMQRKDGSTFPSSVALASWREGGVRNVSTIIRDMTERRRSETRLSRLATLDPLTLLPNRRAWHAGLDLRLRDGTPSTLLLVGIDGFRDVNDTLGHAAGDLMLKRVAERLVARCADAIMVARLVGDEFAVLVTGEQVRKAQALAADLLRVLAEPYDLNGHLYDSSASIGIALLPRHGTRTEDVLGAAHLALSRAKAAGGGTCEMFQPTLRDAAVARRAFEVELRTAFETGAFELFYQPQVRMDDQSLIGAEALMRWNHPERGLLTPAAFMEVLSRKPSAEVVGEWVLRTACRTAAAWRQQVPGFRIGVNLFEAQMRSGRLLDSVWQILAETGLPPEALELELVETLILEGEGSTLTQLHDLRALGVGLAFDDYGTGFASLSLLKQLPVSRLKVDRSFVRNVNTDPENAALVRAVLDLGRSFGLDVIAEGVESAAQAAFLRDIHCRGAQGYLFGRPAPAAAFARDFIG